MRLNTGDWSTEATRTLDALRKLKTEGPVEFWNASMVKRVAEDAERLARSEDKAIWSQHVLWAAGNLIDTVNTRRWIERQAKKQAKP